MKKPDLYPLVILTVIIVLAFALKPGRAAQPDGEVVLALMPASAIFSVGETFTVTIQVQAGEHSIDGVEAYLDFDPNVFEVSSMTAGNHLSLELLNAFDNTSGEINFAAGSLSDFPSGTFRVATITLTALTEVENTSLAFVTTSARQSDVTFGGASVLGHTENGLFNISTSASTPSPTATSSPSATNTPSATATSSPSATNTPSPSATNLSTATSTPSPTATNASSATSTPSPTATNASTATQAPANTPTLVASATNPPASSPTKPPAPSATNSPTPTPTAIENDKDDDGVADQIEDGAPNNGDGNYDGTPDSEQTNVTSLPSASQNNHYVTLISPEGTTLVNVAVKQPSDEASHQFNFAQGIFDFSVSGLSVGEAITVALILHANDIDIPLSYWKYGPTSDNPTAHWYDFSYDGTTGAIIDGSRITLHFVDGKRGDADLTVNGQIIDPGAPAWETELETNLFLPLLQR